MLLTSIDVKAAPVVVPINEDDYDCELHDAVVVPWYGSIRLNGVVMKDRKGRFMDGALVVTTDIQAATPGGIYMTKKTRYKVFLNHDKNFILIDALFRK